VRVTAAFNRMLALPGTTVREVTFEPAQITVTVALRRRRLVCADCQYWTRARYDTRTVDSRWRHLDLGRLRLVFKAMLRLWVPKIWVYGVDLRLRVRSGCPR
jgi:hypothetical protein